MRRILVIAAIVFAFPALTFGQCTSGSTPIRLTTAGAGGSIYLAADGDTAVASFSAFLRVYRRQAAGWTFSHTNPARIPGAFGACEVARTR